MTYSLMSQSFMTRTHTHTHTHQFMFWMSCYFWSLHSWNNWMTFARITRC